MNMQHVSLGAVHTHTRSNLIDEERVDKIYSKSIVFFKNRLLFNKQNLVLESKFRLLKEFEVC